MLVSRLLTSIALIFSATTTVPTQDIKQAIPVVEPCKVSVEACITKYFPDDPKVAKAVFTAESQLDPKQIGYNCRYNKTATTTYVTVCKKGDRDLAISKDYGLAQINEQNYKGDKSDLFDVETNMKVARIVYESQGWRGWYVYRDGKYLQYLD